MRRRLESRYSVKEPPPRDSPLESIVKIFQVGAIIAAGTWTLHEYFSFQRQNDELQIKQGQFAVDTASLNKEILKFTAFNAEYVSKSSEVKYNKSTGTRLEALNKLDIKSVHKYNDGTELFQVSPEYKLKNISDAPLEITWNIFQLFTYEFNVQNVKVGDIISVDPPPDVWNLDTSESQSWKRKFSVSFYYPNSSHPDIYSTFKAIAGTEPSEGALTGKPLPGETLIFTPTVYVRARPDQFVATALNYNIDGATEGWGLRWMKDWRLFGDHESSASEHQKKAAD
jgi:hypothetical protein